MPRQLFSDSFDCIEEGECVEEEKKNIYCVTDDVKVSKF